MENNSQIFLTCRKDYKEPIYLVDNVHLIFTLNHKDNKVTVENTSVYVKNKLTSKSNSSANNTNIFDENEIKFNNNNKTDYEVYNSPILNGTAELKYIAIDGQEIKDFNQHNDTLILDNLPDKFTLKIITVLNPWLNKSGAGLYLAGDQMLLTQCEPNGFRKITYYQDRPDVMAIFTTTIIADAKYFPTLLSNGNKIEEQILNEFEFKNIYPNYPIVTDCEKLKIITWHDPFKKPCYLFALVAGDLGFIRDIYTTKSGRKVNLEIYTDNKHLNKTEHAMVSLKKAFSWDESRFNLEYDLDTFMLVATHNFNMGAMENKGLNIFNAKYVLADFGSATDIDFINIESVIGHEYFHNWTGNRVTCRDWFQLSLKEGLTVFRDQEFTADLNSRSVKRINDVKLLKTRQFTEDSSPLAHSVRPDSYIEMNNFYTMTVYEKGAEVVRMYQTILGIEGFNKGLALYFKRHDSQAVTCDDFCSAMMDANPEISSLINIEQFMLWYSQAGTPLVNISTTYNSITHEYVIECNQLIPDTPQQTNKNPMLIPIKIGLLDSGGHDLTKLIVTEGLSLYNEDNLVLLLDKVYNKFVINNVTVKPVPSILREFSAPIKLNYAYTNNERLFLIQHDNDEFNRFEHLQQLYIKYIKSIYVRMLELFNENKHNSTIKFNNFQNDLNFSEIIEPQFWNTLKEIIKNPNLSAEFRATLLNAPNFVEMQSQIKNIYPNLLHLAINKLYQLVGDNLFDSFLEIYNLNLTLKYKFADHDKRTLKNIALFYIIKSLGNKLDNPSSIKLIETMCLGQYNNADNMTDKIAVLYSINDINIPLRNEIFDKFYVEWQHDELVMDKWFSICSTSCLINIDILNKLMVNKAFIPTNPNKIYALLRNFTMNGLCFNTESGYSFISDKIIAIDKFNPHVASTLASGFSQIDKLHEKYRLMAKTALNAILRAQNLSPDVFEIVTKILVTI